MMKCEDGAFPIGIGFDRSLKLRRKFVKFRFRKHAVIELVRFDNSTKCSHYLATVIAVSLIQTFPETYRPIPDQSLLFWHLNMNVNKSSKSLKSFV